MFVLQYASNTLLSGSGTLIQLTPDGTRKIIASEQLTNPTALTLGSDGEVYISNKGFKAGEGEVLRIDLDNKPIRVPESSSVWGIFVFSACSVGVVRLRKKALVAKNS